LGNSTGLDKGRVNGFLVNDVEVSWSGGLDNGRVDWDSGGLSKLEFVSVSVNNSKVLWLVLGSKWHELGSGLGKLESVGVSVNNGKVLWLVLSSKWHELGLSLSLYPRNFIKSDWNVNLTKGGSSLVIGIKN